MADHYRIRRFLAAWEIVADADRLDEYAAEIHRTQPPYGLYELTIGQSMAAREMARRIPEDFGSLDEREAAVKEHWAGSAGLTALAAIETIAREVMEDRQAKPVEPADEPQECPPEPPADWQPTYLAPAEQRPAKAKADDYVPPWRRRKAGGQ